VKAGGKQGTSDFLLGLFFDPKDGSCLAYSLTLKMEATCFSEMSVGFQQTTQLYILEEPFKISLVTDDMNNL
jgi:hypothetical protein